MSPVAIVASLFGMLAGIVAAAIAVGRKDALITQLIEKMAELKTRIERLETGNTDQGRRIGVLHGSLRTLEGVLRERRLLTRAQGVPTIVPPEESTETEEES